MRSQLEANGVKQDISSTGKSRNPGGNTDVALTGRRRTDGHAPHLALHTQHTEVNARVEDLRLTIDVGLIIGPHVLTELNFEGL